MKVKILLPTLVLAITTPLAYAADEVLWLDGAKKDVQAEQQALQLPTDKPALQLPVNEQALIGRSVDEIVAFAEANPNQVVAIALAAALAAKDPEQATLIIRALIAKFPNNAVAIQAQLARAYAELDEYTAAVKSKLLYSEAIINPTQDTVNNIQASANQGKISQKLANLLITAIVLQSGGGVIAPPTLPSPS